MGTGQPSPTKNPLIVCNVTRLLPRPIVVVGMSLTFIKCKWSYGWMEQQLALSNATPALVNFCVAKRDAISDLQGQIASLNILKNATVLPIHQFIAVMGKSAASATKQTTLQHSYPSTTTLHPLTFN
jgi:hypothetical protein